MTYDHEQGRRDLLAFGAEQPDNFWQADPHLQRTIRHWAGEERARAFEPALDRYGAECAGPIDAAVRENDRIGNHPRLERWGPFGDRIEAVDFHPTYHQVGRALYGSGAMALLGEKGRFLQSQALGYLAAQLGEAGHNCPIACTAGVIKALLHAGDEALQSRYLPRLLSTDYETLAHGAQFLTEVQGGSDVGANAIRAVPVEGEDGQWRIHGEKWFCSNATADLILMTARPDGAPAGTRGLGLFLVPRRLPDGSLNRYFIRRRKEKLGTRTMASGEIDFGGGVQDGDDLRHQRLPDPQRGGHQRHRPSRLPRRLGIRPAAQGLRPAHPRLPDGAGDPRRHGHRDRRHDQRHLLAPPRDGPVGAR
jgi:acyl-CoA dehydrogenase